MRSEDQGGPTQDNLVAEPLQRAPSPDPPSLSESESYVPTEVPTPSTVAADLLTSVTKVPVDAFTVLASLS